MERCWRGLNRVSKGSLAFIGGNYREKKVDFLVKGKIVIGLGLVGIELGVRGRSKVKDVGNVSVVIGDNYCVYY